MKIGIMQPYLFPYLGYFQLINAVDKFVIYDDANYIKQGYINRNNILMGDRVQRFTLAVPGASSFLKISELCFSEDVDKLLKTLQQAYRKKPYFNDIYPLVERVLKSECRSISYICEAAFREIFNWLGINKKLILSSRLDYQREACASGKVVSICRALDGQSYFNSIGGKHLYQHSEFAAHGLALSFIKMDEVVYPQGNRIFQPGLSMIDVLMHCSPESIREYLTRYQLF
jgi:hypothetical protein